MPGDDGRKRFERLRRWNRRSTAWSYRHPWANSAINASIFTGIMTWGRSAEAVTGGVWLPVGSWLVMFVGGALISKHLPRNAAGSAATDLTIRGSQGSAGDVGEDGRRWRTGAP